MPLYVDHVLMNDDTSVLPHAPRAIPVFPGSNRPCSHCAHHAPHPLGWRISSPPYGCAMATYSEQQSDAQHYIVLPMLQRAMRHYEFGRVLRPLSAGNGSP